MISLLEWVDTHGFWVDNVWDIEKGAWIGEGPMQLFPHQRRIFEHCFTPDEKGELPYTTVVYSCPKKSGKSKLAAMVVAWYAECCRPNTEIFVVANDIDQATRLTFNDLVFHAENKLGLASTAYRVQYTNGTFVQSLANQYSSAAGARQALSVFDELWAYTSERSRRMWAEMTPPPTVPNAMRFVATYAGFENESDQLLELYNMCFKKENGEFINGEEVPELADLVNSRGDAVCRRNGRTFIYWDTEPRMPWQSKAYYEEQMMTLRPSDFLRMHRNTWVSSNESFIPIEMWDRAARHLTGPATMFVDDFRRNLPVSVGIDVGMKHDCSALVGVYWDPTKRRAGLAFSRIWTPPKDGMLDLEFTVEEELIKLHKQFRIVSVVYDPAQFQRSTVTLQRKGLPMVEYPNTAGNMILATQALYDLLKNDTLDAYPDPELRDHVRYATAETTSRGFRLVKGRNAKFKIDAAIALAMACFDAINRGGVDTSIPVQIVSPFSDATAIRIPTIADEFNMRLPEALRD